MSFSLSCCENRAWSEG